MRKHDLKTALLAFLVLLAPLLSVPTCAQPAQAQAKAIYTTVPIKGRVALALDIYLPEGTGPYPTVLFRTPYNPRDPWLLSTAGRLRDNGYAVVINHCRGRYDSQGDFYPFKFESADGTAVADWIARQWFCNGKIGVMGGSYQGSAAWQLITNDKGRVSAAFIIVAPSDVYRDIAHFGGAFALDGQSHWLFMISRRTDQNPLFTDWVAAQNKLPLSEIDKRLGVSLPVFHDFVSHPLPGTFWDRLFTMDGNYGKVRCPVFTVGGWNDPIIAGTVRAMTGLGESRRQAADDLSTGCLIGPWDHIGSLTGQGTKFGDSEYGAEAKVDVAGLAVRWFDHWLKGKDLPDWQTRPWRLYVTGANEWRDIAAFPEADQQPHRYYLKSEISADGASTVRTLTRDDPGESPPDSYRYDPEDAVPTIMSQHILFGTGPKDVRAMESRPDVLSYTSEPLAEDLFIFGAPKVLLYVRTDAPDTDFTAWLTEVDEKGVSLALRDSIFRLSTALDPGKRSVVEPGKVYGIELDLSPLCHVVKSGHRLRLDVSSSNFPTFDRNLNTGTDNWLSATARTANQTILHDTSNRSCLVLPVARTGKPATPNALGFLPR